MECIQVMGWLTCSGTLMQGPKAPSSQCRRRFGTCAETLFQIALFSVIGMLCLCCSEHPIFGLHRRVRTFPYVFSGFPEIRFNCKQKRSEAFGTPKKFQLALYGPWGCFVFFFFLRGESQENSWQPLGHLEHQ